MVFLDQHGISHYTDLEQKITVLQDSNEQTAAALKAAERRLSDLALLIKHTATYKELKPLYSEYKNPVTRKSIYADVSAKSFSLKRRRGR